jgi:hypothetical protein
VREVEEEDSTDDFEGSVNLGTSIDTVFVHSVDSCEKAWFATLSVEGCDIRFKLDTMVPKLTFCRRVYSQS